MNKTEKRKNVRVPFRSEIVIQYNRKELHLEGDSVNLSMGGMLVESRERIPLGTSCRIQVKLTGTQEPMGLSMQGTVVRHDPAGFGIHFEEMDLDSYSLLKEIIRHNTSEPDRI